MKKIKLPASEPIGQFLKTIAELTTATVSDAKEDVRRVLSPPLYEDAQENDLATQSIVSDSLKRSRIQLAQELAALADVARSTEKEFVELEEPQAVGVLKVCATLRRALGEALVSDVDSPGRQQMEDLNDLLGVWVQFLTMELDDVG